MMKWREKALYLSLFAILALIDCGLTAEPEKGEKETSQWCRGEMGMGENG